MQKLNQFGKIYDWETWFAGGRKVVHKGKDFACSFSSIIQQARNAAIRFGYDLRVTEKEESVVFEAEKEVEKDA